MKSTSQIQFDNTPKNLLPFYLLWGYRKCGTTALAHRMKNSGIIMPEWDESNIWLAPPEDIPRLLNKLWNKDWEVSYRVDLSTMTHLCQGDPVEILRTFGFYPYYPVCTRQPGKRWLSAFNHMKIRQRDRRKLANYIDFYSKYIGISIEEICDLETELIERDLTRGIKKRSGVIDSDYFLNSYPAGFTAEASDPLYQFRYFGETIDMLYKRPEKYIELPVESQDTIDNWINSTFNVNQSRAEKNYMNSNSLFNKVRYNPYISRMTRHIPRSLRNRLSLWIENTELLSKLNRRTLDTGMERTMIELVNELLHHSKK